LKQALRVWYDKIDNYLHKGFKFKFNDMSVIGNNSNSLKKLMYHMETQLEMIDFEEINYFIGMEIHNVMQRSALHKENMFWK